MNDKTVNKAKEFEVIYKYLFNRIDFEKFKEFMERALNKEVGDSYIEEKWQSFIRNPAGFAASFKSFLVEVIDEMEKINYKG